MFLSGNQAFIRLVFEQSRRDREAGLNTGGSISGYRGSPFGSFDAEVHKVDGGLTARDIHFNPGVNEAIAAGRCSSRLRHPDHIFGKTPSREGYTLH